MNTACEKFIYTCIHVILRAKGGNSTTSVSDLRLIWHIVCFQDNKDAREYLQSSVKKIKVHKLRNITQFSEADFAFYQAGFHQLKIKTIKVTLLLCFIKKSPKNLNGRGSKACIARDSNGLFGCLIIAEICMKIQMLFTHIILFNQVSKQVIQLTCKTMTDI